MLKWAHDYSITLYARSGIYHRRTYSRISWLADAVVDGMGIFVCFGSMS